MVAEQNLGALFNIARAGVVAEPLPEPQKGFVRAGRDVFQRGERLPKAHKVLLHGFHARLLQHNLGNPDILRVSGISPGEGALVFLIPVQKQFRIGAVL